MRYPPSHPGGLIRTPWLPHMRQMGRCILDMVRMQRHHPTTCKARVRLVKLKTYPSMVLVPSLYKIGYGLAAADE